MFTGIITHTGIVKKKTDTRMVIGIPQDLQAIVHKGMSVAVDGICFTVIDVDRTGDVFSINYMAETARKTTIGWMPPRHTVNLELPATPESFLSGHIVQGHVDGIATIESIVQEGTSRIVCFSLAKELAHYMVAKGSVAINGISLTIIDVGDDSITVGIIPHTWTVTNVSKIGVGDHVNIEVDILAKYIKKSLHA